jgi:hypothetical protein
MEYGLVHALFEFFTSAIALAAADAVKSFPHP